MNQAETQSARLVRIINELEQQAEVEKTHFTDRYHRLFEGMKLVNLLKRVF